MKKEGSGVYHLLLLNKKKCSFLNLVQMLINLFNRNLKTMKFNLEHHQVVLDKNNLSMLELNQEGSALVENRTVIQIIDKLPGTDKGKLHLIILMV
jgi:hypothetical protein